MLAAEFRQKLLAERWKRNPFREDQLTRRTIGDVEYLDVRLDDGRTVTLKKDADGNWKVERWSGGAPTMMNEEVLGRVGGGGISNSYDQVINDIINQRKQNPSLRKEQLGKDIDTGSFREREAEVAFDLEEKYGYFERYKSNNDNDSKGDWISLSGKYKGKTFDLFGLPDDELIINLNDKKTSLRKKFFGSLDKHFEKADFVILDIEHAKKHNLAFYEEIMSYIETKYGLSKLIIYK